MFIFYVLIGLAILFKVAQVVFDTIKGSTPQATGPGATGKKLQRRFSAIANQFESLEEVQNALRKAGLESCNLILGVDYTKSNEWTGSKSFGGRSLHDLVPNGMNPYQKVISVIGRTLEAFDDDKMIPVFGFGDILTTDKRVFPFYPDRSCITFQEVLQRYTEITPRIAMSGPTNFAPLINAAIDIVQETRAYHILIIVGDGAVQESCQPDTIEAIVRASNYPLSIVMIGVGDGPWDLMERFDDELPQRKFDNFQFVNYTALCRRTPPGNAYHDSNFAMWALMEIPEQYREIQRLGLLRR